MTTIAPLLYPIIVVNTVGMDEATWKEYRRKGIGGSDVAAVYGQSPFCTARDLYYIKKGIKPAIDEEDNWVAKEYGHLLEELVARIFAQKTGLEVFKRTELFAHPDHPFMQANVDYFVAMPDGTEAILECKTCNYNARDKWEDGAVPFNYELQVRHYMAITNLEVAYVACLYGNNENEFVYQRVERDPDFEEDMIAQETYFWENYVLAGVEPPYTENGELVLASIRKYKGYADTVANAVTLDPTFAAVLEQYREVREEKLQHDRESDKLEKRLKTIIAPVLDKLGSSCLGECRKDGVVYSVSYKPTYRTQITGDHLTQLEVQHQDIFQKYATKTESRRVFIKQRSI